MSNEVTLALSELAGKMNVAISAADTAEVISEKILGTRPVALSSREQELMLENRAVKIERLADSNKITPAVKNRLVMEFATADDTLSLSEESNEAFDLVLDILELLPDNVAGIHTTGKEKTGPQVRKTVALSKDNDDADETNALKAEAQRRAEANKAHQTGASVSG